MLLQILYHCNRRGRCFCNPCFIVHSNLQKSCRFFHKVFIRREKVKFKIHLLIALTEENSAIKVCIVLILQIDPSAILYDSYKQLKEEKEMNLLRHFFDYDIGKSC